LLEDESGAELLLLFGDELLLLLVDELESEELLPLLDPPLGNSEPPVAEPALTPKYENTLWRQPGCDISELESNVGADCSLLVSPLNTKVCPIVPEELEAVLLLEAEDDEGRNKLHGTATCFPEDDNPDAGEVLEVEEVLELVPTVPELLNERIAKSTRPEAGLMITSLIVPRFSPEEDCTLQLLSLLA